MDRLTQLRGEAGGSRDSLDGSTAQSEAYVTADDSSKFFSLSEEDASFDIPTIKDVSLASTAAPEKSVAENDQLISNLSPIPKKNDLLDSYKFGKEIEAANILSGGVNIFDDNDNSYDGDELVIDDNVVEMQEKESNLKLMDNSGLPFQKSDDMEESQDGDQAIASKDTEVVLQIDGKNVNAIDIGNGLYLYRKAGEEELAAVQIVEDDQPQPSFKFLKVRENAEGNLEVYEEIEVEVPKETPIKEGKQPEKNISHLPIKDINKVINDPASNKTVEKKKLPQEETLPATSTSDIEDISKSTADAKSEFNFNGKMVKLNETRKSPVIHSTPNKEGIPLTKTMVDLQLHPNRHLDNVKTIEVHTDNSKQKVTDTNLKSKDMIDENKAEYTATSKESLIENVKDQISPEVVETEKKIEEPLVENATEIEAPKVEIEPVKDVSAEIKSPEIASTSAEKDGDTKEIEKVIDNKDNETKKEEIKIHEEIKCNEEVLKSKDSNESKDKETVTINSDDNIVKSSVPKENEDKTMTENSKENIQIVPEDPKKDKEENILDEDKDAQASKPLEIQEKPVPNKSEDTKEHNNESHPCKNESVSKMVDNAATVNKVDLKPEIVSEAKKIQLDVTSSMENKNPIKDVVSETTQVKKNDSAVSGYSCSTVTNKSIVENKVNDTTNKTTPSVETKVSLTPTSVETSPKREESVKITPPVVSNVKVSPLLDTKAAKMEQKPSTVFNDHFKQSAPTVKKPTAEDLTISKTKSAMLKDEILKTHVDLVRSGIKASEIAVSVQNTVPKKPEVKKEVPKTMPIEQKPINNNHAAVPFGKWTEANRQEFLNKIKEAKVPTSTSNTKSLKQANDLNRRDVLQKIDSQRQSNSASNKAQEQPKLNVKSETITFVNKSRETKAPVKTEPPILKNKPSLPKKITKAELLQASQKPPATITVVAKQENPKRKELNNQDLIDKTIEGIINRAVTSKGLEPNVVTKEPVKTQKEKPSSSLDAIEMQMNELHGIPFIERPPHELPKVYNRDIKTYSKTESKPTSNKGSKIPSAAPYTNVNVTKPKIVKDTTIIDLDSEEEVIEHEPITGDIDLHKKNIKPKPSLKQAPVANVVTVGNVATVANVVQKEPIITEKDFDKFARRNSITYENCLTVNFEAHKQPNVTKGLVQKETVSAKNPKSEPQPTDTKIKPIKGKEIITKQKSLAPNRVPNKMQITSKLMPVNDEMFNKNYQSKLQLAYQTALTAKRQVDPPITIIEDKPVKVVFMESTTNFLPSQLNVQGQNLSPPKKPALEPENLTTGTTDSLDSDITLDTANDEKATQDNKVKTKHQRKQVLTPVEAPELELIVPSDIGIEVSPKKKRKTEDYKSDKSAKSLLPKKTYLLGRSYNEEPAPQDEPKVLQNHHNPIIAHQNTASAIDNLVKAAELLETQSESMNVSLNVSSSEVNPQATPVKRGRGRPRKNPLPEGTPNKTQAPSPQKKPRLIDAKKKYRVSTDEDSSSDEEMVRENWTMGKINENIVCPICSKLFRSENVVFKHVKHCTGPSPNRSDSDKRSLRKSRYSRRSESQSIDEKSDESDRDFDDDEIQEPSPKKRDSKDSGTDNKDDVIVIENTPVKEKVEKTNENKHQETKKPIKTKAQYKTSSLSCEYCGKSFRQLSYLVNHKLLHKKENSKEVERNEQVDKTVFSCEVCKKDFRKLHHLVQHRIIHNPPSVNTRPSRKSSSEQHSDSKPLKDPEPKPTEDQSAAFRCEPCDKSFRKLHHLVEHRETHDGINRQKTTSATQATPEKVASDPPPQCEVCKKTFRKLHHLIEHKEQHLETSSEKSDDKSVKSSLSTRDIIHECPLCYMVFPNEHSLNKHSVNCQKKKRQSALKQAAKQPNAEDNTESEISQESVTKADLVPVEEDQKTESQNLPKLEQEPKPSADENKVDEKVIQIPEPPKVEESKPVESTPKKRELEKSSEETVKGSLPKIRKEDKPAEVTKANDTTKTKVAVKDKQVVTVSKRRQSNLPLAALKETPAVDSNDEDEVRYMINPNFVEESNEGKVFLKVRAMKRNSLQFDAPKSKEFVKRRTSLQHPLKIPRLKTKPLATASDIKPSPIPTKSEPVPSTDSDDSDIKYSFPVISAERTTARNSPKEKKTNSVEKKKVLSTVARRKSSGKGGTAKQKEKSTPEKQIKRRRAAAEHRCDCGQLFLSAALLARHHSLAHTPPRSTRRRPDDAPPAAAAAAATAAATAAASKPAPAKPGRPPKNARTPTQSTKPDRAGSAKTPGRGRKTPAHRGVPVPEKMKKMLEKVRRV